MSTYHYVSWLSWAGRTDDYDSYTRQHQVEMGNSNLTLSADAAFRGDGALPNPEQLLVAAASSCQLLSFLALAARSGVRVLSYTDRAEGDMPTGLVPVRLTRVVLRPQITVTGASVERVRRLVAKAHEQCYIANSLRTDVVIEPTIEVM